MGEALTCTAPSWHSRRPRGTTPRMPRPAPARVRVGQFATDRPSSACRRLTRLLRRPAMEQPRVSGRGVVRRCARAHAGHHQPDGLARAGARSDSPMIGSLVHDQDPVRERHHLVEVLGDDQHGGSPGRAAHGAARGCTGPRRRRCLGSAARPAGPCGSPESSRAMMSFWMLPPDRFRAGVSSDGVLTSNAATSAAQCSADLAERRKPQSREARASACPRASGSRPR